MILLADSTLREQTNWFTIKMTEMSKIKNSTEMTCVIKLVCDRKKCRDDPLHCIHMRHHIPHFHSAHNHEESHNLITDKKKIMTELLGIPGTLNTMIFSAELLDSVFSLPIDNNGQRHGSAAAESEFYSKTGPMLTDAVVFVIAVDPDGGGRSNYSIVSTYYTQDYEDTNDTGHAVVRLRFLFMCDLVVCLRLFGCGFTYATSGMSSLYVFAISTYLVCLVYIRSLNI